jgi:E3 ubiquitin-protein ligase HUWE1
LAHENQVLSAGIKGLSELMEILKVLGEPLEEPGSSVLLRELASSKNPLEAVHDPSQTPLLHAITAVHSLVMMFIHVCRTGQVITTDCCKFVNLRWSKKQTKFVWFESQSDIRTMAVSEWGSTRGLPVLRDLANLYLNLVWESTVLLALCSGEYQPKSNDFARSDLDRLIPPESLVKTLQLNNYSYFSKICVERI